MAKVLIIDTSILCVYLALPGFDRCGPDADPWDYQRVHAKIAAERTNQTSFVLPLATIIETGNHIAQLKGDPYPYAQKLAEIIRACCDNEIPWTAFSAQGELWSDETLRDLANTWPEQAGRRTSIGDATIALVASYYHDLSQTVEILTGDAGLKVLEPFRRNVPRRR